MKELYLIYVNYIGVNHEGNYLYEFIFSDTTKDIDGDEWDAYPASGRPKPPHLTFIKKVGVLCSELKLALVQASHNFCVWDAIDGVVSLAWEDIDEAENYPKKRLCFKFGEKINEVTEKLYEKDLILHYDKLKYGENT
jgi:hypothetical protein